MSYDVCTLPGYNKNASINIEFAHAQRDFADKRLPSVQPDSTSLALRRNMLARKRWDDTLADDDCRVLLLTLLLSALLSK